MHELSIAHSLVTLVQERLPAGVARVTAVRLRVGVLAGVVPDALQFCYGLATEGTLLEGSTLRIEDVPIVLHCAHCRATREVPGVGFRCPACGAPSGDVRQGRELDLASIEYDGAEAEAQRP